MGELALVLFGVYLALAFGLRTVIQVRRTGSTGFVGLRGRPGSVEWLGGVLFAVALLLGVLAPLLDVVAGVGPVAVLDGRAGHRLGGALTVAGIAATLAAQLAMGTSWRIGVDPAERTALVTSGPFALVRNPIFAALELQTRRVEEPYLVASHGEPYLAYAAGVGRFVPGVGLLRRSPGEPV